MVIPSKMLSSNPIQCRLIAFLFGLLFTSQVHAQTYTVQGKVSLYYSEYPVKYAKVTFIDQSDTTRQYSTTTDTSGHYRLSIITGVKANKPSIPSTIELAQNYPNPFSSSTAIAYKLSKHAEVNIKVFDILGREVKSFTLGLQGAGTHGVLWDGKDNFGNRVASGIYFYRLRIDRETKVKKMLFGVGSRFVSSSNNSSIILSPKMQNTQVVPKESWKLNKTTTETEYFIKVENTTNTTPNILPDGFFDVVEKDTTMNFWVNPNPCASCGWDFSAVDYAPAWSPDGKTIAYVHSDTASGKTGIYLIDASVEYPYAWKNKRLWYAGGAEYPSWSPDGEWIVFHDRAQIYKLKLNGDSLTQLTFDGRNFYPDWSPDGQWIAYSNTVGDPVGIWISPIDGSGVKTYFTYGAQPEWFYNRLAILYGNRGIWSEELNHSEKSQIYSDTVNVLKSPKITSDGTKIAFTSSSTTSKYQIWVIDADGTNLKKLTKTQGYTCDWSPDGEWIVYTDSRFVNGRLWIMRKDGTARKQITFNSF